MNVIRSNKGYSELDIIEEAKPKDTTNLWYKY